MNKLRHIHSKIGTETAYRIPVSVEGAIAEAVAAYDQMAAKLDRMSRVLKDCAPNLQNKDELYGLKWAVCDIINETPAVSLLLHDAEVLEKCRDKMHEFGYKRGYSFMTDKAAQLRSQAAALEGEA